MKLPGKLVVYGGVLGILILVFAMYGQSDFLMMLTNQMWSCF
jgi:hypothetical protein